MECHPVDVFDPGLRLRVGRIGGPRHERQGVSEGADVCIVGPLQLPHDRNGRRGCRELEWQWPANICTCCICYKGDTLPGSVRVPIERCVEPVVCVVIQRLQKETANKVGV